jgi:hypothetical protein
VNKIASRGFLNQPSEKAQAEGCYPEGETKGTQAYSKRQISTL